MKQRFITGAFYVAVMAGLLVMKILIPVKDGLDYGAIGVDVLFWLIAAIGAFEFTRAVGVRKKTEDGEVTGGISPAQRWVAIVTCSLMTPAYVIAKMVSISCGSPASSGHALVSFLAVASVGALVAASLMVFDHDRSDLKSTAYAELCILYCGALTCVGPNINHLYVNSEPAILLLFIIVPFVDSGAFFVGKLFGKLLPLKLAPKTSPNKTVIGAVGGVLGGVIAAVLVWVICEYSTAIDFEYAGKAPKIVLLILISLPTSVLAQLGDLFESAIKRSCGIKDMGKILPGHGGVLDRFDSMLFATISIVVCFLLVLI